jgi:hypothetical protein
MAAAAPALGSRFGIRARTSIRVCDPCLRLSVALVLPLCCHPTTEISGIIRRSSVPVSDAKTGAFLSHFGTQFLEQPVGRFR